MTLPCHIFRQILDDPTADDRIVRHDQNGDDRIDPAAEPQAALFAKGTKGTHRAFVGHAAQCRFGHDHRVAKGDGQHDVHQQKNAAAVFRGEIRKPPDVAKADRSAGRRQDKSELPGKCTSFMRSLLHVILLSFAALPAHDRISVSQERTKNNPLRTNKVRRGAEKTGEVSSFLRYNRHSQASAAPQ